MNRLAARLGSGLVDTAATLSVLAQDAPARLQQELTLFWEEVEQEAARLDREGSPAAASGGGHQPAGPGRRAATDPQEAIDALRAQVARLARRLEVPVSGTGGSAASPRQGPGPS
jgi:hypothetical protein